MILTAPQGVQVFIAVIGLGLNLIVGFVVTFGLELKSTDLIMILLISLIDIVYYSINLLRMILISVGSLVVVKDIINPEPKWWCPFDATMDMATYLSCIEIVAILSFMRYLSICKKRNIRPLVWYLVCAASYITNLTFALIYYRLGNYKWSGTGLACVTTKGSDSNDTAYTAYYYFWFTNYIIRSFLALITIAFSYFNVTSVYYEIISSSGDVALKEQLTSNSEGITRSNHKSTHYFNTNVVDEYLIQERNIRKQKWMTVLKLCGAILAYSLCLIPDITLSIINLLSDGLLGTDIPVETVVISNLLLSSYGIVSAIFVLLSHDPSKRYLSFKLECFFTNIKYLLGY